MLNKLTTIPLLSLLVACPAFANTETLTFTGSSSSFCTVTNTSNGTLAQNAASTSLSTLSAGGAAGTFTVATNAAATLDLDDALTVVSEPSGANTVREQSILVISAGVMKYNGDGSSGASAALTGNATGTMNLTITKNGGGQLTPGSYSYSKTVTCSVNP